MLDYSREWKPRLEQIALNELVGEVCAAARADLRQKGIDLIVEQDANISSASVDVEALRQVLDNLLVNAADAVAGTVEGEGGIIKVLTRQLKHGDCQLIVNDNGCGIAPEHLEAIFIPHFSTKGEQGNGLGLASAKKQLNGMGGDIKAESMPGKGSTFTITVPSKATQLSN